MKSALTLVPTPIAETLPLEEVAKSLLLSECLLSDVGILVEEHKVGRQRWLKWGLPREAIERFTLFNEHTQAELAPLLVTEMKKGKRFYLLSDSGLPAFCDPGQRLVDACHRAGLKVSATPFPNSTALALALSGFSHHSFYFAGFLPAEGSARKDTLESLARHSETMILMDTPYRLKALLKDIENSSLKSRNLFLATNLNQESELLIRGRAHELSKRADSLGKVEFVLVVDINGNR